MNAKEAAKFRKLAGEWWDPRGPFMPLHRLNPTRVEFMVNAICDSLRWGVRPWEGCAARGFECGV